MVRFRGGECESVVRDCLPWDTRTPINFGNCELTRWLDFLFTAFHALCMLFLKPSARGQNSHSVRCSRSNRLPMVMGDLREPDNAGLSFTLSHYDGVINIALGVYKEL